MISTDKQQMLALVSGDVERNGQQLDSFSSTAQQTKKKVIYLQKDYKLKPNLKQTTQPKTTNCVFLLIS